MLYRRSKSISEYVYKPRIIDVDPDTDTLLIEFVEEDGLDGFSVSITVDELLQKISNNELLSWAQELVDNRASELYDREDGESQRRERLSELEEINNILQALNISPSQ